MSLFLIPLPDLFTLNYRSEYTSFFEFFVLFLLYKSSSIFCFQPQTRDRSSNTGSMRKIWKQKTPLCWAQISISTGTLVPSLQICTLTRTLVPSLQICTLTGTPVPSLLWHFLCQFFFVSFCSQWKESENNFNMASRKTEYVCTLQQNTSLPSICLKNGVPRLHKAQYRSRY